MTTAVSPRQASKRRKVGFVLTALVLLSALSGCVIEPYGYDRPHHYWHERY
jgi:hypothetical protein